MIEVDADSTPWGDVDEGEEFQEENTPTFKQIKYTVKKKKRRNLKDHTRAVTGYRSKYPGIPE